MEGIRDEYQESATRDQSMEFDININGVSSSSSVPHVSFSSSPSRTASDPSNSRVSSRSKVSRSPSSSSKSLPSSSPSSKLVPYLLPVSLIPSSSSSLRSRPQSSSSKLISSFSLPSKFPSSLSPNSKYPSPSPSPSKAPSPSPSKDPSCSKVRFSSLPAKIRYYTPSPKARSPSKPFKTRPPSSSSSPNSKLTRSSSRASRSPSSPSRVPFSSSFRASRRPFSSSAVPRSLLPPSGSLDFSKGVNNLDKVILRGPGNSSAEVYLYGAQVMSWKNQAGEELLFVSSKANFTPPKPIRGGIPICFPQFLNMGSIERHGFARTRFWKIDKNPPPIPTAAAWSSCVDLILDEEDRWTWQHKYEFRLRVALGYEGELRLTSRIRNIRSDGKSFTFTFAYHPYLLVSDIWEVRVEGIETSNYFDHLKDKELCSPEGDCIWIESEVDKIYLRTPVKIAMLDHEKRKTIELRKSGLLDCMVWNPWEKKAQAIEDLGNQDYKRMLCLGAAAIEYPITLKPGQEWKGLMELTFVPTSYHSS